MASIRHTTPPLLCPVLPGCPLSLLVVASPSPAPRAPHLHLSQHKHNEQPRSNNKSKAQAAASTHTHEAHLAPGSWLHPGNSLHFSSCAVEKMRKFTAKSGSQCYIVNRRTLSPYIQHPTTTHVMCLLLFTSRRPVRCQTPHCMPISLVSCCGFTYHYANNGRIR